MTDRRIHDGGRRGEDHPLMGMVIMAIYGVAVGIPIGYMVRAWWG